MLRRSSGTALAFPLFALTGLPVAIAGLGWGVPAAALATALAALAVGIVFNWYGAAIFVLLSAGPILWLVRLAWLSRPGDPDNPEAQREWFPLGRLLLHAAVAVSVGIVLTGILIGYDPDSLAKEMATLLARWLAEMPEAGSTPSATELAPLIRLNVAVMPYALAAFGVILIVLNMWLGTLVARASGRMQRPAEKLWSATLPNEAIAVFLVALTLSFVPGILGEIAGVATGAFGCAVALIGLAVLHAITLGTAGRGAVLTFTYAVLLIFGFPILILAALGLAEAVFHLRARRFRGAPPPT